MNREDILIERIETWEAENRLLRLAESGILHTTPARSLETPTYTCAKCGKRILVRPQAHFGHYYHENHQPTS